MGLSPWQNHRWGGSSARRPQRPPAAAQSVTKQNLLIMASETGRSVPRGSRRRGPPGDAWNPARCLLADPDRATDYSGWGAQGSRLSSNRRPYAQWLSENQIRLDRSSRAAAGIRLQPGGFTFERQRAVRDTRMKICRMIVGPNGGTQVEEPVGSDGNGHTPPKHASSDKAAVAVPYHFSQRFAAGGPILPSIRCVRKW